MDPGLDLVIIWITRITYGICTIIGVYILKTEYEKRSEHNLNENKYQKWLNIWSISVIIATIFQSSLRFIATLSPNVCQYANFVAWIFGTNSRVLLTFYQISRLQYCFLNKQIHSKKYGYNKYIFYVLYVIGLNVSILGSI